FDESTFMLNLESLIGSLRRIDPSVEVRRLEWSPGLAGDTLVWYFTRPGCRFEVQVDPGIDTLFLIGTDERSGYEEPNTVDEAVYVMARLLYLAQ
ncbi:MAG: hypothetical protein ACAI37_10670, partial [Chthoniobacter sp.]